MKYQELSGVKWKYFSGKVIRFGIMSIYCESTL